MTSALKRAPRFAVLLPLFAALALVACGSEQGSEPVSEIPVIEAAPAKLAALYGPGGAILDEGLDGYEAQIESLEGEAIVVNIWASWCGPCREEFPFFRDLAVERGDEVAFLGVNSFDNLDAAETFLESSPLPYPSYFDPDQEIRDAIAAGGGGGLPATVFYNAGGEITYVKYGPYTDQAGLAADVDRYALGA